MLLGFSPANHPDEVEIEEARMQVCKSLAVPTTIADADLLAVAKRLNYQPRPPAAQQPHSGAAHVGSTLQNYPRSPATGACADPRYVHGGITHACETADATSPSPSAPAKPKQAVDPDQLANIPRRTQSGMAALGGRSAPGGANTMRNTQSGIQSWSTRTPSSVDVPAFKPSLAQPTAAPQQSSPFQPTALPSQSSPFPPMPAPQQAPVFEPLPPQESSAPQSPPQAGASQTNIHSLRTSISFHSAQPEAEQEEHGAFDALLAKIKRFFAKL